MVDVVGVEPTYPAAHPVGWWAGKPGTPLCELLAVQVVEHDFAVRDIPPPIRYFVMHNKAVWCGHRRVRRMFPVELVTGETQIAVVVRRT